MLKEEDIKTRLLVYAHAIAQRAIGEGLLLPCVEDPEATAVPEQQDIMDLNGGDHSKTLRRLHLGQSLAWCNKGLATLTEGPSEGSNVALAEFCLGCAYGILWANNIKL